MPEVTPAGYRGPAQHTYTNACDGFHEPGPCKLLGTGATVTAVPLTGMGAAPLAVAPELAAAMAETRTVRDGYQALCQEFGPSQQSGWSARISMTVLNRHRRNADLEPFSRTESNQREDLTLRYRRERDEARAQLAEVRRITYQGGQDAASVRRELLACLEASGGREALEGGG